MQDRKFRRCYFISLAVVLMLSLYPLWMGISVIHTAAQFGHVPAEVYPKYIIPYAPLCLALCMITALMPLLFRVFKRGTLLCASIFGSAIFLGAEIALEGIPVLEGYATLPLESWQYSLCYATPEVLQSIGEPIYAENNPAYKVHYYLIALVLLLCALQTIHGFLKMVRDREPSRRRPLVAGLIALIVFAALCVFACFTAFYRDGNLRVPTISAVLMAVFFIAFGVSAGTYMGALFYGKTRVLSR